MSRKSEYRSRRQDAVAAVLFCCLLSTKTREAMKKKLLRMVKSGKNLPDSRTREGLALLAFTTSKFVLPNDAELEKVLPRVELLLTKKEKRRLEEILSD